MRWVFFDYGQTLGFLSLPFLRERASLRGLSIEVDVLERRYEGARAAYDAKLAAGIVVDDAWHAFMVALLGTGSEDVVRWLWAQQPEANLWRAVPDEARAMLDDLHERGTQLAVLSKSVVMGFELLEDVGLRGYFDVVADSGVLGVAKPDPAFFAWALREAGVDAADALHIGDSLVADVEGARAVGITPLWFDLDGDGQAPADTLVARDYTSLRAAIHAWLDA